MKARARRPLVLFAFVAFVIGAVAIPATTYRSRRHDSGPKYSLAATERCLKHTFRVDRAQIYDLHDKPHHRELYIYPRSRASAKEYPSLLFFTKLSVARDYARGDSAPLLRRGNVVVGVEDDDHLAAGLPDVKAVISCLRGTPSVST